MTANRREPVGTAQAQSVEEKRKTRHTAAFLAFD
jgi:hypothetical protein